MCARVCVCEVYVLCVEAKDQGQSKIPVHIFPTAMEGSSYLDLKAKATEERAAFWQNLETAYLYFEQKKILPKITVNSKGAYQFN